MKTNRGRISAKKYWIVVWKSNKFEQILEREQVRKKEVERKEGSRELGTKIEYISKY